MLGNTLNSICPLEIENAIAFAEQVGTTRMTLHAEPFGASAEEVKFAELCSSGSLEQGYGGTFDQLADHLLQIARRLPSPVSDDCLRREPHSRDKT